MNFKETYLELEPRIRATSLVGNYMMHFAAMELQIEKSIRSLLELSDVQAIILCSNLTFSGKIKILRTLNSIYTVHKEDQKINDKRLIKISDISRDRNMLAHSIFIPDPENTDGAVFFRSAASGSLKLSEISWSIDDFVKKYQFMQTQEGYVKSMSKALKRNRIQVEELMKRLSEVSLSQE